MEFKTYYDTIGEKEGTINTKPTRTDQSQAEEADIQKVIEKYGIESLIQKTMAKDPMYLDMTNITGLTLDEALRQREQMEEYFKNMPAKARKVFGDNPEEFITSYKQGKFEKFFSTGALSEEQAENIMTYEKELRNEAIQKFKYEEEMRQQAIKEIEAENVKNTME